MKTAVVHHADFARKPNLPYPNAATRRQLLNRFIDLLLTAALGIGAAAIFLFILALA